MPYLTSADWPRIREEIDARGWTVVPGVLPARECRRLAGLFARDGAFRSTVEMESHGYGRGRYRYFRYPLPAVVERLRQTAYAGLAPLANDWAARLGGGSSFPPTLAELIARCAESGQKRPTPLLLRYGSGDFNRMHQDVYGPVGFPLQMLVLLSQRGEDYDGGEVILTEQRPRMQSRATAITPGLGDALFFPNRDRPIAGRSGFLRAHVRHGASEVRTGERVVLGVIFHDAL